MCLLFEGHSIVILTYSCQFHVNENIHYKNVKFSIHMMYRNFVICLRCSAQGDQVGQVSNSNKWHWSLFYTTLNRSLNMEVIADHTLEPKNRTLRQIHTSAKICLNEDEWNEMKSMFTWFSSTTAHITPVSSFCSQGFKKFQNSICISKLSANIQIPFNCLIL